MKVVAIETASTPGSIALLADSHVVAYQSLDPKRRTTQDFAVVMQILLQQESWSARSIDLVAVCDGPGSFTGLRIGVTAAKTFAYATGAEVLAINTLELIASQVDTVGQIVAVLDAQRGQFFSATYAREVTDDTRPVKPTAIYDADDWLAALRAAQTVTGPGLRKLAGRLPTGILVADEQRWCPRADQLATLALKKFQRGERQDLWQLKPMYYRRSAAEEKAE